MYDFVVAWRFRAEGRPTIRVRCAAGRHGDRYRCRHRTDTENATGDGPRQRRHLHAAVGPCVLAICTVRNARNMPDCPATRYGRKRIRMTKHIPYSDRMFTCMVSMLVYERCPAVSLLFYCRLHMNFITSPYAPANRIVCYTLLYDRRRDSRHLQ